MRVVSLRRLEGVSPWSSRRTLAATLTDMPAGEVPAPAVATLINALGKLTVPIALKGPDERLRADLSRDASWPALLAALVREWQFLTREFRGEAFVSSRPRGNQVTLAFECEEFALAEPCLRSALEVAGELISGRPIDLGPLVDRLSEIAYDVCFGGQNTAIADAARARGVPCRRVMGDGLVQIGEGVHLKRFSAGTTSRTDHLAVGLSTNKANIRELWSGIGVPIAEGRLVRDADDAVRAAEAIRPPIAVKPADSDYGRGVTLDLTTSDQVRAAYHEALAYSSSGGVLVERSLKGLWHRLLVVEDRLVAALRREPATVVGNGKSTIAELVVEANRDPRRGPDSRWPLYQMELGDAERVHLARFGRTFESVPEEGERVALRAIAHTETGATSRDVLDIVHPDTIALALDAVRVVGLDVAGLDVIAEDLSRPLHEQGGGFLEINAGPALFLHFEPISDPPRPVAEAIVDALMPPPSTGRVPLILMIGRERADALAIQAVAILERLGKRAAISTGEGTMCGTRRLHPREATPPGRLHAMMTFPRTEAAVLAASMRDLLEWGPGTDRAHLLVLADLDEPEDESEWRAWFENMRTGTPLVWSAEDGDPQALETLIERAIAASP